MNTWLEKVLLDVDNRADTKGDKAACLELVNFYRVEFPLRALAYGLKARRLGEDIELTPLEAAVERLRPSDWSQDAIGAYKLGLEMGTYPVGTHDEEKAAAFLEVATKSDIPSLAGMASFQLAELLRTMSAANGNYRQHAYYYYERAKQFGVYDLLYFDAPRSQEAEQSAS